MPSLDGPALRLRDVEGIVPLAAGCLLLAYIEGVSAARAFAAKHGYPLDPRQEFLGMGAANLAAALGHGYPVAGGLSQSAVNDKAGARTPLALVFASVTLALCLLFLTGLLENLPKAVLAAVVLTAVYGLMDFPAMLRMWRISRSTSTPRRSRWPPCCCSESCTESCSPRWRRSCMLLTRASHPHVAFLGRSPARAAIPILPATRERAAAERHRLPSRSLVAVRQRRLRPRSRDGSVRSQGPAGIRLVVCDLSASPHIDLAGSGMLHRLHDELAPRHRAADRGAHGRLRDLCGPTASARRSAGLTGE